MARPARPFLVQEGHVATIGLIASCIAGFIWLEFRGGSSDVVVLILNGAKFTPLIKAGEWWRLLTCMFLHSGVMHLAVNLYSLYNLGSLSERLFGSARFLAIYLASGLWGSIASTLLSDPMSVSIGASGAVFGVAGSLFYFATCYPKYFMAMAGRRFIAVVAANLIIGFTAGGIDGIAHLGGLVGGFVVSFALGFPYETPETYRTAARIGTAAATIAGMYLSVLG
ncbi:MAG: Rhomboid protease GluP [Firmicutes bacterium ADurb.Bin506]|nr:MAG: Rhomboid protease GluP [Firmicutes bacterium ADurb.Bin506]